MRIARVMTPDLLTVGEIRTNARPGSYGSDPALARRSGSKMNTREPKIPLTEQAKPAMNATSFAVPEAMCAVFALSDCISSPREDKRMKIITLAAIAAGFAAFTLSAGATTTSPNASTHNIQPSCPAAPAVASAYLKAQAGKKLTMARAAVIAEITKQTGADGEFAGLKPCDSGYPNAVRFYIDEVIKAGTNNSTP
jgi:hypothetical protein